MSRDHRKFRLFFVDMMFSMVVNYTDSFIIITRIGWPSLSGSCICLVNGFSRPFEKDVGLAASMRLIISYMFLHYLLYLQITEYMVLCMYVCTIGRYSLWWLVTR
ncbi:hypothetical protein BGZ63DRAFT_152449 [Mariannaea sp. PMI_226]|nr:hypothetical protein BGZ63DRAFT_152449 [Mariannaea sp. PMI_226]